MIFAQGPIAVDFYPIYRKERMMSKHMHIFGLGYTSSLLMQRLQSKGWSVSATKRAANDQAMAFDDEDAVLSAIEKATHILSSVPPMRSGGDPVLEKYGDAIANADLRWSGYLSSSGVYGDARGAWVDESADIGNGRRKERSDADMAWQSLRDDMHIFRLPGIYGPGRSALDRMASGNARRIDMPDQVFSRIHVDDIIGAVMAAIDRPHAGVFNIADDEPCSQNEVIAFAAQMLGLDVPPLQSLKEANLSEMAMGFYAENRRVANGKAKRLLGWEPQYYNYRLGLRACMAITNPMQANSAPDPAISDH